MQSVTSIASAAKFQPDGSLQVVIEIEPSETTAAMRAIELTKNFALTPMDPIYGKQAQMLRKSQFFLRPDVWEAIGTDTQYQAWARKQKCAVTGEYDWDPDKGEARCTYCHVRRAADSGTAYKPDYSGVPMVDKLHQLQHTKGELEPLQFRIAGISNIEQARRWFEKQAISHVERWGWEVLKYQLGFDHWNQLPPRVLRNWAAKHALVRYLPNCYREGQKD